MFGFAGHQHGLFWCVEFVLLLFHVPRYINYFGLCQLLFGQPEIGFNTGEFFAVIELVFIHWITISQRTH